MSTSTLNLLWTLMRGQRLRYACAIGAIGLTTICTFLVPLIGRATIDGAIASASNPLSLRERVAESARGTRPGEGSARANVNDAGGIAAERNSATRVHASSGPHPSPLPEGEGAGAEPGGSGRIDGSSVPSRVDAFVLNLLGGADHLRDNLWLAAVAMFGLTAAAGFFTFLKVRWSSQACETIGRRLRERLYDHMQRLPCNYLDKADTGDLVQRCTSDVETTRMFLAVQVVEIGNALILLATVLPIMLALDAGMTAVSLALVPILVGFAVVFFIKVKHRFKAVEEAESKMTTVLQENLTGIRVVRAFARQEFEIDKFSRVNTTYRDTSFKLVSLMAWYWTLSDFFVLLQMALALGFGAWWIAHDQMTVGTLYAFLAYLQMMLFPVRQMGRVLTDLGKAVIALGRIREILEVGEEEGQGPRAKGQGFAEGTEGPRDQGTKGQGDHPQSATRDPQFSPGSKSEIRNPKSEIVFSGAIAIRQLTFSHASAAPGGQPTLSDVSLTVKAGETLALLGPSGAGKSTLMHLLLRLYDYEQGEILFDNREIRSLPRHAVRSQVGVVMQEPFLFAKSLGENIRHGRTDALQDQIAAAAEIAQIHETIVSFDHGYETVIGERGVNLSGGQRQRVAIARAVVRDPAILILDDALSAVDSRTESAILDAIRQRRGRRTTLLIAHRLSTLMQADQIVVLDKGRIVQRGTHEELRTQEGLYRNLWRIQSAVEEELEREMQVV